MLLKHCAHLPEQNLVLHEFLRLLDGSYLAARGYCICSLCVKHDFSARVTGVANVLQALLKRDNGSGVQRL